MFADELRRVVESAARVELPAASVLLWKAFGAGQVTEAEAEGLVIAELELAFVVRILEAEGDPAD